MYIHLFLLGLLPIFWLIVSLAFFRMAAHLAAMIALVVGGALAACVWNMSAAGLMGAALEGVLIALWPICVIIIAALFTYNVTVESGAMEKIRNHLKSITNDQRVLLLLIAWGFGNFMEGMAGFGTAVAVPAALLVGVGMHPLKAVTCCLVANTTPTAFGSVGVPLTTLSSVTGCDLHLLAATTVVQQAVFTFLIPFLMMILYGGLKALRGVWRMVLLADFAFLVPWFVTARFVGVELPNILGGLCVLAVVPLCARKNRQEDVSCPASLTLSEILRSWAPFGFVVVGLGLIALCAPLRSLLDQVTTTVKVHSLEVGGTVVFRWLNTPGVVIFCAALMGAAVQGVTWKRRFRILGTTVDKYWKSLMTICCVLALARVMTCCGMIRDIASVMIAVTGPASYPFVAPLIGSLGGFITGSGTSANVLFGGLQVETAKALSCDPVWIAAANMFGAGLGKMICPQSIAIGIGAVGAVGQENVALRGVFFWWLFAVLFSGVVCFLGA